MEKLGVWKGWASMESCPLMQTSSPLGAGEYHWSPGISAGSYNQFLKWAAQDRFLLPEGTCRPHRADLHTLADFSQGLGHLSLRESVEQAGACSVWISYINTARWASKRPCSDSWALLRLPQRAELLSSPTPLPEWSIPNWLWMEGGAPLQTFSMNNQTPLCSLWKNSQLKQHWDC